MNSSSREFPRLNKDALPLVRAVSLTVPFAGSIWYNRLGFPAGDFDAADHSLTRFHPSALSLKLQTLLQQKFCESKPNGEPLDLESFIALGKHRGLGNIMVVRSTHPEYAYYYVKAHDKASGTTVLFQEETGQGQRKNLMYYGVYDEAGQAIVKAGHGRAEDVLDFLVDVCAGWKGVARVNGPYRSHAGELLLQLEALTPLPPGLHETSISLSPRRFLHWLTFSTARALTVNCELQ